MILYLLRRDDAWKIALTLTVLAPFALLAQSSRFVAISLLATMAQVTLMCAIRLRWNQRTSGFEITLPIAGRELLLVRILGMLSIVWVPVGAAALLLFISGRGGCQPLLQGAVVFTLAASLPLTLRLREATVSGRLTASSTISTLAIGAAGWYLLPPLVHLTLFATVTAAILLRACLTVPDAFEVSPRAAVESRPRKTQLDFHRPAWWPILRSAMPWIGVLSFLCAFLLCGTVQTTVQFSFLVFQAGIYCRDRTRWLQALPLSRRVLLWTTMATTMAPLLSGVAIAAWIYRPSFVPQLRPRLAEIRQGMDPNDKFAYWTNVPLEFWRRAPQGKVPPIAAPWGETAQPTSLSILGVVLYNPYSANDGNTKRFFEWQVGNATQTMNGRRFSWDAYMQLPHDATPDYPQKNRVDILAFATLSVFLLFLVYLREASLSWHLGGTRFARYLVFAALLPMLVWMFSDYLFFLRRYGVTVGGPVLQACLMHLAAILPQNSLAFCAIAAAPSVLMYLLVERQFARSETTGPILPSRW